MMWIFEWDILTGDSAVLDVIYEISRDDLDEAIAGGDRALAAVDRMRASIEATDAATWRDPELRTAFLDTLDYQASTYDMLGDYREMFLRQAQWHDTGDAAAHDAVGRRAARVRGIAPPRMRRAYAGDVYYPAYNLTAAELGVERAERDLPMAWAARVAARAARGVAGVRRRSPGARGSPSARRRRRPRALGGRHAAVARRRGRPRASGASTACCVVAVPALLLVASRGIQTWFLAPAHLLVTLGAWLVFVLVRARGSPARARSAWPVLAAVGGAAILRVGAAARRARADRVPAATGSGSGPTRSRAPLYVTVAFAAFGWVVVAAAWALATQSARRRATGVVIAGVGVVLARLRRPHRRDRPRARAHRLERPDGAAAVGALADPRHHGLPRHPGRHGVVRGRGGSGARARGHRPHPAVEDGAG